MVTVVVVVVPRRVVVLVVMGVCSGECGQGMWGDDGVVQWWW